MGTVYLDHAATTPVRPEVRDAMAPWLGESWGNPSSLHAWGRRAQAALEEARERVAAALGAAPDEVVFTSGGTEANHLAVVGRALAARGHRVLVSAVEHRSVLGAASLAEDLGNPMERIPVDGDGRIDLDALAEALGRGPAAVVSVQWVNNELGTLQPLPEVVERAARWGAVVHTDAVQAIGKVPVAWSVGVDLLSLSGHKLGAPAGVGALVIRRGVSVAPLFRGAQERGRRGGTEPLAAIVGLAVAVELAVREQEAQVARWRALQRRLEEGLRARLPDVWIHAADVARSPALVSFSVPDADGLVLALDVEGIAVSTGSACASGSPEPSHVLAAIGLPEERRGGTVRVSFGRTTTEADVDRLLDALPRVVARLRTWALL